MKINGLPTKVGSLKASNEKMKELADALAAQGEGAAIAVDTANKVVVYAETAHKVMTTVEVAGGVTVLVKTGATLLVKEGIKACAKKAATEFMVESASGVASHLANYAAKLAGIPEEQRQWIAIGVDSYQAFALFKAAKTKIDWDGSCFVAGTKVIVGMNADGSPVTRNIEEIQEGDYVLSRDQFDAGDDIETHRVEQVFHKTSDHLRILAIQDANGNIETIKTTDEHPFYVNGKGWIDAGELQSGTRLSEIDGSDDSLVLSSVREAHPEGIAVFNFEVQGDHTYFVEDGSGPATALWVHNRCAGEKWLAKGPGGKPVEFDHVQEVQFFKRSDTDYGAIKTEFDRPGGRRDQWLESIGLNPNTRAQLEAAGMTPAQIDWMVNSPTNKLPAGWQVHHKQGIKLGGDNDDDNFMIFRKKDDFYHKALTNEQSDIQAQLVNDGDVIERTFPMFNGKIIFTDAD